MNSEITLTDLFDVEMLQRIQDAFAKMTGIAAIIHADEAKNPIFTFAVCGRGKLLIRQNEIAPQLVNTSVDADFSCGFNVQHTALPPFRSQALWCNHYHQRS